ncbi:hypothetical protein ONS95_013664 [Cadophora gregata]|uniref:uncharacterized protein n=1 Tax=Cadophora gregata TaxID=51156 RepID=UPI0026DCDF49|nr:uncharacterized protein ONS95_013664 [Cadophora gregata]KAK0114163.1 hypothetical protein ONS95_013664 [Cadophora gregata]
MTQVQQEPVLVSIFKKPRKFLVDNAGTMKPHWGLATYVLQTLLMLARRQDENGMDVHFTYGDSLSIIFEKYLKDAENALKSASQKSKGRPGPRNLTLIVLTGGIWEATKDLAEVKTLIVDFVSKVEKLVGCSLIERQVSIEFVQFGLNTDASHWLEILDNGLEYDGIPDIVDTEHCFGDPIKMLLGSFNSQFDEKEDNEESDTGRSRRSQQLFDSVHRSDSTLYRAESSASQTPQRRSMHSAASPSLGRNATSTPERQPIQVLLCLYGKSHLQEVHLIMRTGLGASLVL